MMDINDSEFILTATLLKIEAVGKVKNLTFSTSKKYKGEINVKTIRHSLEEEYRHGGDTHHVDTVFIGQEWIVFGSFIEIDGKQIFKLNEAKNRNYCMLSRPSVVNDPYLTIIKEAMKIPTSQNKVYYKNKSIVAIGSLNDKNPFGAWKYYTRNDLDHYWEGEYVNGKRDGTWQELAMNYKKEKVIINTEQYENGILKERITYNYIRWKRIHETFSEKIYTKVIYRDNAIYSIQTLDKTSNTSTIKYIEK